MLKTIIYVLLVSSMISVTSIYADNPGKGKDKASKEEVKKQSDHKYKDSAGEKLDKDAVQEKGKSNLKEHNDAATGLKKQSDKKAGQEQKELDKGSEQGQESREEHRRKWWKFWESDES